VDCCEDIPARYLSKLLLPAKMRFAIICDVVFSHLLFPVTNFKAILTIFKQWLSFLSGCQGTMLFVGRLAGTISNELSLLVAGGIY
jgi:hypothetical protein